MTPDPLSLDQYRPQIEAALAYSGGTHTFDDIRDLVSKGQLQFWPGPHSVGITEIQTTPQRRTLNIFLAGGDKAELEAMLPAVIDWAKAQGCTHALMIGRRGWERTFMTRTGWKVAETVVLEREL